ncbi:MAG: ABC transporter permease [Blastocatellia bacterium]|nr:ABC transporter permease [Blastocatellia bacterium]
MSAAQLNQKAPLAVEDAEEKIAEAANDSEANISAQVKKDRQSSVSFYLEAVWMAWQEMLAHKLRAFLTLIGIIIGVSSVVLVGAAISGLNAYVVKRISELFGPNHFMIARIAYAGKISQERLDDMYRRNKQIEWDEYEWLKSHCASCAEVGAAARQRLDLIQDGRELDGAWIIGVTDNMKDIENKTIVDGRFIAPHEVEHSSLVCVIGMDVRERFFPDRDPLGQTIKINGLPLRVVGVEKRRGAFLGDSMDNQAYIPLTTFRRLFGRRSLELHGCAASREELATTIEDARMAMRNMRKLAPGEEDNFAIANVEELNTQVDQFTGIITLVVTPITLISLLVGGIVIMNIMLVSVSERTFEIGLRKSVGARRRHILLQFLIESALLASLGGILGLSLAASVAWVMNAATTVPMKITPFYILLSLLVSGGIGLIFGVYPAYKAAGLDPIVALTRE